jgi:hypothetical protein
VEGGRDSFLKGPNGLAEGGAWGETGQPSIGDGATEIFGKINASPLNPFEGTSIRFQQDLKCHPDALGPGQDLVPVFMEALEMEPPLTIACSDQHLLADGLPVEQGAVIELSLLPQRARGGGKGFG